MVTKAREGGAKPARKGTIAASPAQMRIRRDYISGLLLQGATWDQIRVDVGRVFEISEQQVRHAYDEILDTWSRQEEADAKHQRAAAIQRLSADLVTMRGQLAPSKVSGKRRTPKKKINWKDINAHESLLAKVQGTLRPVEVKVDVDATTRRSLLAIVGSMTGSELDQLVEEQRELEQKARSKG